MIKLSDNAELLLNRLLNAIDKLALHSVPIEDWDGERFESLDLADYPSPADVPESPSIMLGRSVGGATTIAPTAILSEIWSVLAGDGNSPGLEDYISGDWRDETP
jgi:hypothetical protein